MYRVSVRDAFAFAWHAFQVAPWLYALMTGTLIMFLLLVSSLVGSGAAAGDLRALPGLILIICAGALVQLAFARFSLAAVRGTTPAWNALWVPSAFPKFFLFAFAQSMLFQTESPLVLALALIVAILLSFTQLIMADKSLGLIAASRESIRLVAPHADKVAILIVVSSLLNVLGLVAFGVGLFVSLPVCLIATAYVYRTIHDGKPPREISVHA